MNAVNHEDDSNKNPKFAIPVGKSRFSQLCHFLIYEAVVEWFLFLTMFGYMARSVVTTNLCKDKACLVQLAYNKSICDNLHNYTNEENAVQVLASDYQIYFMVIAMGPAVIVVLLLGSWSDIYGRKWPMIYASLGILLETVGFILNLVSFDSPLPLMLLSEIPVGLTGGLMVMMNSVISYFTDISGSENRAIRFAVFEMSFIVASPIGTAVGGIIFNSQGYLAVYLTSMSFQLVGLLILVFGMKEPNKKKINNVKEAIGDLFSLENVRDNIRTCTKKREGWIRGEIWLLIAVMGGYLVSFMGTVVLSFLFTMKMYGWDTYRFSIINMAFSISQGVIIMILVPVMIKIFKLKDATLGVIGSVFLLASTITKGLAFHESVYYIACVLGLLGGISNIGVRTRLSKLVAKEEIGKVFSVLSMTESLIPVIGTIMFGAIYSASVSFFPGLAYCVSACFLVPPIVAFTVIFKWGNALPTADGETDTTPVLRTACKEA